VDILAAERVWWSLERPMQGKRNAALLRKSFRAKKNKQRKVPLDSQNCREEEFGQRPAVASAVSHIICRVMSNLIIF
jgi:hypothetical protein